MKNKKQIRLICLLMLCAMLTGIIQPAAADASAPTKVKRILSQMGSLAQIPETNFLLAQSSKNNKWGVYDTDANIVLPLEYEDVAYLSYGFFSVGSMPKKEYEEKDAVPPEDLNTHALMTLDGTILCDYLYGAFKALSPNWVAAWVLEEGTKADNDYKYDKTHFFRIQRCDIFYYDAAAPAIASEEPAAEAPAAVEDEGSIASADEEAIPVPEEETSPETEEESLPAEEAKPAHMVLSLTRDEYKDAVAHEQFLSIQNRENAITMYNSLGEALEFQPKNLKSGIYGIKNWMLVNLITGEMLMDGCSEVSEAQVSDGLFLIATRTDFQGIKWNSLITTKGEVIMPMWNVAVSNVSREYAVLTSNTTGKKGLFSCLEKRLILPIAFDEIFEDKNATDRYISNGCAYVSKDEEKYLYNIDTKELLPIVETETELQRCGATFYTTVKSNKLTTTQLYAPDGSTKSLYCSIEKSSGTGYILCANFSGSYTVINWYGKDLLPQKYSKKITVTSDDRFIIQTKKSGYELYKLVE